MVNLLTFPVFALGLFFLPGYLFARLTFPSINGTYRLAVAALAGPLIVGALLLAWVLLANQPAGLAELALVSGLWTIGLGLLCHKGQRSMSLALTVNDKVYLATAVSVALMMLVHYDRDLFQFNCVNRASALLLGIDPFGREPHSDYILAGNTNVRMGNVALVAPSFIAFKFFGPRLLYAFVGGLIAVFGCLLGHAITGQRKWAVASGALLALNPYVLAIPILDENLFAYLATTVLLLSFVDDDTPPVWLGLILGYLLGFRHIALLVMGGVLLVLWRRRPKALWLGVLTLTITAVTSLWAFHHWRVFGSPFAFESFREYHADYPHSFLGMHFGFRGLLNFPFHETLIRTPYNAYPNILLMPLWLLNRFGLLGVSLAVLGFASLRRSKLTYGVIALYCIPLLVVLAPLESWMQPNKMGIQLTVLPIMSVAIVAGLQALLSTPKRLAPVAMALIALLAGGQYAIAQWSTPADERVYTLEAPVRVERTEYLTWEREHLVRHNVLPDWSRAAEYTPFEPLRKLHDVYWDLTQTTTIMPPSPPKTAKAKKQGVRFTVDLSTPLIGASSFIQKTTDPPTLAPQAIQESTQGILMATKALLWSPLAPHIALMASPETQTYHLVLEFGEPGYLDDLFPNGLPQQRITLSKPHINLELPEGSTLVITEVVADHFSKYYRWKIPITTAIESPKNPTTVFTN